MVKGLVSIITPVYNGEDFLDRSIQSVLAQTYEDWELILIDDGSKDSSIRVIEKYLENDKIHLLKNESNSGIPTTRNKGIRNSNGEYIALLDQDDEWLAQKLSKQVKILEKEGDEFGLIYSNVKFLSEEGIIFEERKGIEPNNKIEENFMLMLFTNLITSPTVLIKKTAIQDVGLFDESINWGGDDYDLWLRISQKYKFRYIDEVLSIRHEHTSNYSSDKTRMMNKTIELTQKYVDLNGLSSSMKKKIRSNHYYRFGIESLKKKDFYLGLSYILKSLFVSKQGFVELGKTIRNRF